MSLITPDFGIIFWQFITFFFVLFILKKFAWKKIINLIEERENSVRGALSSAKEAKRQLDRLEERSKKILDNTNLEAERILKEAIAYKAEIIKNSKKEASRAGADILEKTRRKIEKEKNLALMEIKNDLTNIVLDVSEKILMKKMENQEQQKEHIDKLLENSL